MTLNDEYVKPSVKEVAERLLAGCPSGYGMMSLTEVSEYLAQGYLDLKSENKKLRAALEKYKNISCSVQSIDMAAREALENP